MLLEVRHVTQYHYAEPVRESVMELWMQPQKSATQRLLNFDLELDPVAHLFSYPDSFGNAVYHFDVPHPHQRLEIIARSAVETQAPQPLPDALDRGEWDRLRSDFVKGECFDFLRPHGYACQTDALVKFVKARGIDELRHRDPLSAARALSQIIYDSFEYETGVTEADSPIDLALNQGRGVCQDFAHIMIAICRDWGLPARYVSGYVFTNRGESHDRSDPDASHAWVQIFLPSLRWVGIDPTNNIPAGERHVCVAVGRDYADVPPSRGVFKGEAESQLAVGVSVRRARAAPAEPEFLRMAKPAFAGATPRRRTSLTGFIDEQRHHQQQQQQ
ncbi:MAG TPA: transglutaminase family protein [Caulobacteraceae bacterium]|nr:transglutaminase family protein [Caulobacteraceae bacterium]